MGSGPSPPTYPLQNSFREVDARVDAGAGAKAAAEAKRDAKTIDFMVIYYLLVGPPTNTG
jgi:hypothetical protein